MKLAILFSGGKDSVMALIKASEDNDVKCLIAMKSENPESYMFHRPAIEFVKIQAEALGIPLIEGITKGVKEEELEDLKTTIAEAKKKYHIEGIVTGAIASIYQASRIQRLCRELDLWCINPLWLTPQSEHIKNLVDIGVIFTIVSVSAEGMGREWLGKTIDRSSVDELLLLEKRFRVFPAGEGGEYESFVIDCPLFKKRININAVEKVWDGSTGILNIKSAVLEEK